MALYSLRINFHRNEISAFALLSISEWTKRKKTLNINYISKIKGPALIQLYTSKLKYPSLYFATKGSIDWLRMLFNSLFVCHFLNFLHILAAISLRNRGMTSTECIIKNRQREMSIYSISPTLSRDQFNRIIPQKQGRNERGRSFFQLKNKISTFFASLNIGCNLTLDYTNMLFQFNLMQFHLRLMQKQYHISIWLSSQNWMHLTLEFSTIQVKGLNNVI